MQLLPILVLAAAAADPRLVFSTFHGGDRNDDATAAAVDKAGFIYVAGETESRNLEAAPVGGTPLVYSVFKGYLTKYSPDGKQILWRLLIGGSSNTVPRAVAIDPNGDIFVAGTTGARDLPLKNPVQATQSGLNICFLMKFNPDGELLFSTYFGGERNDEGRALAVDSTGAVYLAGRASSTQLPVKDALQPVIGGGGEDGFIAKFTPDLQLAYATYLGGASSDQIHAIAVGPDDSLYVTGETMSPGMATEGAHITQSQSYSSFAARIAPDGSKVEWYSYVGWRGGYTTAKTIAVDAQGRAVVGGYTSVKQMPVTENAIQTEFGGGMRDGFLLRLSADGSTADYLTYLGGSVSGPTDPDEGVAAVRIDNRGHVHVAGFTNSHDFPVHRAFQADKGGSFDAYLLRMDLDDKRVFYSSFWGGSGRDEAGALALGPGDAAVFAGVSYSSDLPVENAEQPVIGSANDAFVAQVCDPWPGYWSPIGWNGEVHYVRGGEKPEPFEVVVYTFCQQPFEAVGPESSSEWLAVSSDGGTVPMKLKLEVNVDALEPGEHHATVKVTVPAAYYPVVEIPVTVHVSDPPTTMEQ